MRGQILGYDITKGEGIISTADGARYTFSGSDWRGNPAELRNGAQVDFSDADGAAKEVYLVPGTNPYAQVGDKSPIVAGLLALFLGGLGVHKFYLGYNTEGVILLVGSIISWILLVIAIGFLGLMGIWIVTLVEAVIYLTKSPAEFEETYVKNRKPWF